MGTEVQAWGYEELLNGETFSSQIFPQSLLCLLVTELVSKVIKRSIKQTKTQTAKHTHILQGAQHKECGCALLRV